MKRNYLNGITLALITALVITSCGSDDEPSIDLPVPGESGFFVVNEGAFGGGNASLSYFDKSTTTMTNDIFTTKNEKPLGDQAQSMIVVDTLGYIVVQSSNKVEVIDVRDFSSVMTITEGISSPRYMVALNSEKGYISDWGEDGVSGTVKVVDLVTKNITKSIATGQGANKMIIVGDQLYVTNKGGRGFDNTVQVINTNTDTIVKTIEVGDKPNSIVADDAGNIWVAGTGNVVYADWPNIDEEETTSGFIAKIVNDKVEVIFSMPDKASGPSDLEINSSGENLYFDYLDKVYTLETKDVESEVDINIQQLIDKTFYGIDLDPFTDNIIGFEAPDFSSAGTMHRYDKNGSLIDSYEVGIGPNGVGL